MKYFIRKVNRFICNKTIYLSFYEILFIICIFLFKLILIKYITNIYIITVYNYYYYILLLIYKNKSYKSNIN